MSDQIESLTHRIVKNAVNAITELENDLICMKEQIIALNRRYNILHDFVMKINLDKNSSLSAKAGEVLKKLDME